MPLSPTESPLLTRAPHHLLKFTLFMDDHFSGSIIGALTLRAKTTEEAASQGLSFAKTLGCSSDSLNCLQSKSVNRIMSTPFFPRGCIDGSLAVENPILPAEPEELIEVDKRLVPDMTLTLKKTTLTPNP